jgi:membrane protease YdiL (CAAX protease family)
MVSASQDPALPAPPAGLVALVAGHNIAINRLVPEAAYVPVNLLGAAAAVTLSRRAGASWADLGFSRADAGRGLRRGAGTAVGVAGGVLAARIAASTRGWFRDARAQRPGRARAAYDVGVRIPLGTALAEELVFRSAVLGYPSGGTSAAGSSAGGPWVGGSSAAGAAAGAVLRSSVLFGFWHVLPSLATAGPNAALGSLGSRRGRTTVVAASVAATTVAGAALAGLRCWTGSVVAPVLVHASVNVTSYALARWLPPDPRQRLNRAAG